MEIHQLRYFVAVAEQGGFSRAAEHCHVSQPSLSQQIQRLERSLGLRLFDRLGRTTVLTEAGLLLLPRARRILAELREAGEDLRGELASGAGDLAVGAIPTIAPYLLPPLLERFLAASPGSRVTVREGLTETLLAALVSSEIEVALVSTPIEHPLVEVEVVGEERLVVALPPGYPPTSSSFPTLADLAASPAIVLDDMHCLSRQIETFCASRRLHRAIVCRGAQLQTVLQLVDLGLGVSLVPAMCARADATGSRQYAPLGDASPTREIAVAWRRDRSRSRAARRLVELVREEVGGG